MRASPDPAAADIALQLQASALQAAPRSRGTRRAGDDLLRRLAKNFAHLLGGHTATMLFGVVSLALIARALGPELLGVLVTIEAYSRTIDQVVRLETWQATVQYGAADLEHKRRQEFRSVVKFGVLLDLGGALIATACALLLAPLAGAWLGWSAEALWLAQLYCLTLLLHLASTPIAVLRLFDRFAAIAWAGALAALVRLVLVAAAFFADLGLWAFLLVGAAAQVGLWLALIALAWREIVHAGHGAFLVAPLHAIRARRREMWILIWSSNATVVVRKSTQEMDSLIVGGLLGPAAAGMYHVAKRLGSAALRAGSLVQQALYPDLARLWARGEVRAFLKAVAQVSVATAALAAAVLLVLVLALDPERIVALIAGSEFAAAGLPMVVQLAAVTIFLCGSAFRPALMTMGLQVEQLKIALVAAFAFYCSMVAAIPVWGVLGASLAHVVFSVVWLPATLWLFVRGIRRALAVH